MKLFSRHIITLLAFLSLSVSASALKPTISATIDSTVMVMGRQTTVHLEIVKDANSKGELVPPGDIIMNGVETSAIGEPESSDIGSGRYSVKQDITIQSFDSGIYMLPPFAFVENGETIKSNQVVLKVLPVPVDSMKTVHDFADVVDVKREFMDYMPDWAVNYGIWILLALALIAMGVAGYFLYKRNGGIRLTPKKAEPPYNVAMRELNRLKNENLCEQGREREYYTRLTEILRVYLDTRFGINAMEMTSSQILDALQQNETAAMSKKYMEQVLEVADFVKFAKVRPLPQDNAEAFNSAIKFIEDTKPLSETDEDASSEVKGVHPESKK